MKLKIYKIFFNLNNNFLDKNIIAKLPYKNCGCSIPSLDKCTTIFLNYENIISSIRNYFGPIHLKKIRY